MQRSPFILYSDGKGNIFEDTSLYVTGRSGWDALPVPAEDWIELPEGGSLYELPGRRGIGIDALTGPQGEYFDRLRVRNRIAIQRQHIELMAGQGDGAVLHGAGVQQMHQYAAARAYADWFSGP